MPTPSSVASPIFKTRGPLDPVNDSAICAPRPELDQLLRAVNAPTVDAYLAVLSSRQTGKTTLLYQLRQRVRPRGVGVALIDLGLVRDLSEEQMYRFVAGEMLSELEPNLPRRTERRDVSALPTNPLDFRRFLLDLARQVRSPRLLLLMDEVEAVPDKSADAFFGTLRNIFSSRRKEDEMVFEKYLIVFSGSKELHKLTGGPNSPLNIADRIYLSDLDIDGVRFIASNLRRLGISVPDASTQWIFDQTNGHPYLTQKLCAQIEQWRPQSVTPEIVQRAVGEVLRSDDHLEKLVIQIEADQGSTDLLKAIVRGESVPFSRIRPAVARLELLGAIRDSGPNCVVRNAIYSAAFKSQLEVAPLPARKGAQSHGWVRPLVFVVALVVFMINLPFLFFYTTDIILASRSVNDELQTVAPGASVVIQYNRILQANTSDAKLIRVEIENPTGQYPIQVTFQKKDPDILPKGTLVRSYDPPYHDEDFAFFLNISGFGALPYNPFKPFTEHRRIDLIFTPQTAGAVPQTYVADFRVDYYSAAGVSIVVAIGSALGFIVTLVGNFERTRRIVGVLGNIGKADADSGWH